MKKQSSRREARSDKKPFGKDSRSSRGSSDRRSSSTRTPRRGDDEERPARKYRDASKSEAGWTKSDGTPLRKRISKDEPAAKNERPARSARRSADSDDNRSERSGERTYKRSDSGSSYSGRGRSASERSGRSESSERSFSGRGRNASERSGRSERSEDGFKGRGRSNDQTGERKERTERTFSGRGKSNTSDFISSGRGLKSRGGESDSRERRSDSSYESKGRFSSDKKEGRSFRPEKSFDSDRGEKREYSSGRSFTGKSDDKRSPRGERSFGDDSGREKRSYREKDSFDDKRGDKKTYGEKRSSGDYKPERRTSSRDERPFSRDKKDSKRSDRSFDKNKSYRKSSREDAKPFQRFEDKPKRSDKRNQSGKGRKAATENEGDIRLNKYIANAGICSRREADQYITAGLVTVNGEVVTELGTKVSASDDVRYNGERLKAEKNVYVLLNKPKDYITTSDDPDGRKTVMELIAKACKERVYPVGRLDRNTTGVLLFTNDGDLAKHLTHPSSMVRKIYHVELDKSLKKNDFVKLMEGVELEDGIAAVDDVSYDAGGDKSQVGLELHSGKNRVVRRMFEALGYEVKKLDRVMFAGLTKKDLPRGRWRILSEMEVANLKMQLNKKPKGKSKAASKKESEENDQLTLF